MKHLALLLLVLSSTFTAQAGKPDNLLVNSSMETWHSSGLRPVGWGVWTPDDLRRTWQVLRDEQLKLDGEASLEIKLEGQWANLYTGADVKPGETYTYSIYVRCNKPVQIGMKLSVWGDKVPAAERETNRKQTKFDIAADQWQRISVTDTMPPGAERVTAYLFLRGPGIWHFDQAMLNQGELRPYVPGQTSDAIAPLARPALPGETTFTPQVWDNQGRLIADQEVAFAFDADLLSNYRLRNDTAAIGAVFAKPVLLRGVYLLLNQAGVPDDVKLSIQVLRHAEWSDIKSKLVTEGALSLLAFDPVMVEGVRVHVDTNRKLLLIYHLGFAQ